MCLVNGIEVSDMNVLSELWYNHMNDDISDNLQVTSMEGAKVTSMEEATSVIHLHKFE